MNNWKTHIDESKDLLLSLSVRDKKGQIDYDTAFKQLQNYALGVLERRKTIYFIGNGTSASIANDASANLANNTGIRTETFYNFALITAITSDSSHDEIFAEPLRKKMVTGDMLIAISSTGESRNILYAVREALKIGGIVCTLSAMSPNNSLKSLGALNFYIPTENAVNANLCHMEIIDYWIEQMISMVSWQEDIKERYKLYRGKI
ncbi:MAG: SIS domain-containing protein [Desulfobacteraceae bacterium]|jgi:D-sedoheptulose 7-phosphate isomerase